MHRYYDKTNVMVKSDRQTL